ncbi:MAG: hypothetical protein Q9165_008797 [Trypethelium subeluteriae]
MRSQIGVFFPVFVTAAAVLASESYSACPPISGNLRVSQRDIYPEGVEFSPSNCKVYIGSLNNNSVVEFDPYTLSTEIIEFPGITHNWEYFICGIDYSYATESLYVSASARAPWFNPGSNAMGKNLTGPNRLIKLSPLDRSIIWQADVNPVIEEIGQQIGTPIGGFQDSAEDKDGNAYFPSSFGHTIVKIDVNGQPSKFYIADPDKLNTDAYGFGGLFTTDENVLVLSDGVTGGFVRFDLSGSNPSEPLFTKPTNLWAKYDTVLDCDSLIAPRRFNQTIALCSDVVNRNLSPHGMITVYASGDGWKTSKYIGAIPVEFGQTPDVWSTAQFATPEGVYALSSALPYAEGTFPKTNGTTLVEITEKVVELLHNNEHVIPAETLNLERLVHSKDEL